jgi:hypothetical protein
VTGPRGRPTRPVAPRQTAGIASAGGAGPRVEIAILDRRDVPPAGAGETALIAAAPAIANALRAATGHRLTRLPIGAAVAAGLRLPSGPASA